MVPPLTTPTEGKAASSAGCFTNSTCTPLWLSSPPSLLVTSTTCIPSPRDGSVHRRDEDETTEPIEYDHDVPCSDEPPTPQYTPRAAENPAPANDTSLPPSTTAGSTVLTFMLATASTITPLDTVQSWPLDDTSTV